MVKNKWKVNDIIVKDTIKYLKKYPQVSGKLLGVLGELIVCNLLANKYKKFDVEYKGGQSKFDILLGKK